MATGNMYGTLVKFGRGLISDRHVNRQTDRQTYIRYADRNTSSTYWGKSNKKKYDDANTVHKQTQRQKVYATCT